MRERVWTLIPSENRRQIGDAPDTVRIMRDLVISVDSAHMLH